MFKFILICALLAAASAQHHGHGHDHAHGRVHGRDHVHGYGHIHGHGHDHDHGHAQGGSSSQNHVESHHSSEDAHAETKHFDSDVHEHGFHYGFETSNHIKAVAEGDEHGNVHGDFEWISPEGRHIEVNYVADENGYQPKSDVLPTPHPIPEAILKSLEYIASHPHDVVEYNGKRRF